MAQTELNQFAIEYVGIRLQIDPPQVADDHSAGITANPTKEEWFAFVMSIVAAFLSFFNRAAVTVPTTETVGPAGTTTKPVSTAIPRVTPPAK